VEQNLAHLILDSNGPWNELFLYIPQNGHLSVLNCW